MGRSDGRGVGAGRGACVGRLEGSGVGQNKGTWLGENVALVGRTVADGKCEGGDDGADVGAFVS